MKYTKYKTRVRLCLTGDDDLFGSNSSSTYKTTGSSYTNGKTIRFNLNSAFNDIILSHNARCVMETCYVPTITGQIQCRHERRDSREFPSLSSR